MNTQPQLQQEKEDQDDFGKTLVRIAVVALIGGCLSFMTLCTYYANRDTERKPQPEPEHSLICPECDSMPDVTYQYDSITSGSLSHDPFTGRKGILINQ